MFYFIERIKRKLSNYTKEIVFVSHFFFYVKGNKEVFKEIYRIITMLSKLKQKYIIFTNKISDKKKIYRNNILN